MNERVKFNIMVIDLMGNTNYTTVTEICVFKDMPTLKLTIIVIEVIETLNYMK